MSKQDHEPVQISRLVLTGYKSIAQSDLPLRGLNVLIGANGAGKSNYIGFFRFVGQLLNQQLQTTVGMAGGVDRVLHFGRKHTEELKAEIHFGDSRYMFELVPTADNRFIFQREAIAKFDEQEAFSSGYLESQAHLYNSWGGENKLDGILESIKRWRIYHFHDTGGSAGVKRIHSINDNEYLRDDARNLAAFLLRLRNHHPEHYLRIVKTISLVAPFFGDFLLRPTVDNKEMIQLEWTEQGMDEPFPASALSDGTLRFICLATVLLQPAQFMPTAILIDEPELGLHPFAIGVLAGLMKSASASHQLIISTQSVELVNEFAAEDLIVVDKRGGASLFHRPDAGALSEWLADYSLGDLWKKNLLGGRP
jgi:predicted ATPase